MISTKSQANALDVRNFVSSHTTSYPDIDSSQVQLPQPYVVCIIGGRGAAGGALARSYARAGASGIILGARTISLLEEVANEVKIISPSTKVVVEKCDISLNDNVASLAAKSQAEFGGHLDVVVVNSGYSGPIVNDIIKEPPDVFQQAINVNYTGTYHAAHHFLPLLLNSPTGAMSFIGISSMAAPTVAGPVAHIHYCTSKAAQVKVIEMISEQYASKGLFCASVHPGGIKSDLSASVTPKEYEGSK
ncbi:hypothetical protein EYZ11_002394 [Aspergillus tanneri]|uniref:NAD(P)-binding protein n=1 Tax=Aspergillus tanneri TaxID=1220188 RepID=A0A4S3JQZ2_9EURO|nr:hypothetical protein EYZ11_002394 [Aspergillus tanneri]